MHYKYSTIQYNWKYLTHIYMLSNDVINSVIVPQLMYKYTCSYFIKALKSMLTVRLNHTYLNRWNTLHYIYIYKPLIKQTSDIQVNNLHCFFLFYT